MYLPRTHAITPTYILKHKGTDTCRRLREQIIIIQKIVHHKIKWAEVATSRLPRKQRGRQDNKWKTRLNFKVTHCIYMLNNEITKYIVGYE